MDPGVGAPAAQEIYLMPGHAASSLFDLTLHGPQIGLRLPPMKIGPVVGDQQFDVAFHNPIVRDQVSHGQENHSRTYPNNRLVRIGVWNARGVILRFKGVWHRGN